MLTTLDALLDRGPDGPSSADAEDIVAAVVEASDGLAPGLRPPRGLVLAR